MANLLASLSAAGSSLSALERALEVTQNNVTNASTPGYARQTLVLEAASFSADGSLAGGVTAGVVTSSRDDYAEQEVWSRLESLGYYTQKQTTLDAVENCFDVGEAGGLSENMSSLFQSFSAWSASPDSTTARDAVLDAADQVAKSFQETASSLSRISSQTDRQLEETVARIDELAGVVAECNAAQLRSGSEDAGVDARLHAALEELAEVAEFTALQEADGTYTLLLGGQAPLVSGETVHEVSLSFSASEDDSAVYPNAASTARILDAAGNDITDQLSEGQLGALLDTRNRLLPSLVGDAYQPGELNRLAQEMADQINQLLTSGQVSEDSAAQSGVALFTYDADNPTACAATLAVNPSITSDQLAAIETGPPYVSNGIALKLAEFGSTGGGTGQIDDLGFADFYADLAAEVGREVSATQDGVDLQSQLVAQARTLRDETSAVSLDDEAVILVEFQRAYEAAAKMISVLDELMETTVNLID
jgi:flagellar hook-associated protein 1 FlgK